MIEIQFRSPKPGTIDYETVATLTVDDAGVASITGDAAKVPTNATILDRAAAGGKLSFADDPEKWARNVHKILRTGYLVPIVIRDDHARPGPAAGSAD